MKPFDKIRIALMFMPLLVRRFGSQDLQLFYSFDAVRCAFRSVVSSMTVVASSIFSPSIIRVGTPASPHRFHQL